LGEEIVTPLCAPRLRGLTHRPQDLLRHALIDSTNKLVRWPDWLAVNGISAQPPLGMRFDRSFLALSAATNGLGIALESTRLAEAELAGGRLVQALDGQAKDIRYVGHYLAFPRLASRRAPLQAFIRWISRELKLDTAPSQD
jgi:DNA-binding transcriptional LysR family regulator